MFAGVLTLAGVLPVRAASAPAARPSLLPMGQAQVSEPAVVPGLAQAGSVAELMAGVRMAPASPGAVRFTVLVPAPQFVDSSAADGTVNLLLDRYQADGAPGGPPRFSRVITVAVPPIGEVNLTSTASDLASTEHLSLAPIATVDRAGVARALRRESAYAADGSPTPVGARLLRTMWVRNQRVAQIAIEPAAYEPSRQRLTLARRVDVNLQVQPMGALGPPVEAVDPFEPVYRLTIANYDQGLSWRRTATSTLVAAARRFGLKPEQALAVSQPETSIVLVHHSWVKLAVSSTGFYAVNFSTLRNTSLFGNDTTVTFNQLRLFTLPGYPQLPEHGFCDSCSMREVAIGAAVDYLGDGKFNNNTDAFYFFGQGPSGWASEYDPSYPDTAYLNHPYERKSYYYLTLSRVVGNDSTGLVAGTPLRIAPRPAVSVTGATTATTFADRLHVEQDNAGEYWPDASPGDSSIPWENWFWVTLTAGSSFDYTFDLPQADVSQAARFRLRQWGITDNRSNFVCSLANFDHNLDVAFNSLVFPTRQWNGYHYFPWNSMQAVQTYDTTTATVAGGALLRTVGNVVHLDVPRPSGYCSKGTDRSGLAWFEVYYHHFYNPVADTLAFTSPGNSGPYHYNIGPFVRMTRPVLFDITDPLRPMIDTTSTWDASTRTLSFDDTASVLRRYRVLPDSVYTVARMSATQVSDAPATSLDNLRSPGNGADYVVIYYDGFAEAARTLADARAIRLPLMSSAAPHVTKIVPVSAVYDQFSGGRTDPAAIRNFLRAALLNWSRKPAYVEFLGDASYDYKDFKGLATGGRPGCLLPTYENNFDDAYNILQQYPSDDALVSVLDNASMVPDFYAGRIPADDPAGALAAVKKVVGYETSAPLGEYRNAIVLLADDDMQGTSCDGLGWIHLTQTNTLNLSHLPAHEDRDYVYLHTYPNGAAGTKPGARAALKGYLNGGVTMFNYIGHGSPFKVTDESVFIDTDAGGLTNSNHLFAFIAASCDVGKFDDPTVQSLGEDLVMAPSVGAVAVVSATGQALSIYNTDLANALYDANFSRGDVLAGDRTISGTGQYHVPLSAALLVAKILTGGDTTNNTKFGLMGDPATVLNAPHWWADISVSDLAGNAITQVARGQAVRISGRVLDKPGGQLQSCNGEIDLLVEDSAPTNSTKGNGYDLPACPSLDAVDTRYRFAAGAMYHGNVSLTNGRFEGRFVVPMDATLGTVGRARGYMQARLAGAPADSDGVGAITLTLVDGTADRTDNTGPRITLSFPGGAGAVHPDATLHIDLSDQNGIMTTGHEPQNSIIVTLDGNTTQRSDVTPSFRYAADSYQQGTAAFVLPNLSPGHHSISVQAADNLATGITGVNHRSRATIEFDVVNAASLRIDQVFLFPNPIRARGAGAGGTFIVNVPGDSLNTMIRVYTITGRVVRTLKSFGGIGQVQIPWDGKDAEGEPLANGTYLFKVYANVRDADGTSSPRQEDAAVGRFVVINR